MLKKSVCSLAVFLGMFGLPTTAALFRIYVHQDAVQLGYALSAAERQRDVLHGQLQRLEVELAAVRSPGHLAKLASSLGLRPPSVMQVISGRHTRPHLARAEVQKARHARR
jgi:hypothetical protein